MSSDEREMADTCLIISGGPTDRNFASEFVKERKYPYVVAVDAGLAVFLLTPGDSEHSVFLKDHIYGKYVSFLPLTEKVLGITLDGFKYPLHNKDISILENPSLCVSNEVPGERAKISFREGILICVESRD